MRDGSVTVMLPRAGATVRRVAELVLAKLGLSGQILTEFNRWAKVDFLQDATNQLMRQGVANTLHSATGAEVSVKVIIKASLIEWLQAFGLGVAQAPSGEFSHSPDNNTIGVTVSKDSESYRKVERKWKEVEAETSVFSTRFIREHKVRTEYQRLIRAMSKEVMSNFEKGLITEAEAARIANEARNKILAAQRLKSSDLGRELARYLKDEGKTLAQLQEAKAKRLYRMPYSQLNESAQKRVWLSIVESAGRDNPRVSKIVKWGGRAGKVFAVVTVAIAVWNIAQAENKVDATLREGSAIGGAFAGAAIGGWAGAVCGPGAVICVPLGIFVGGILGAYAGESLYDAGRSAVVSEAK